MTKEQLQKLDILRDELFRINRYLSYMEEWGNSLYDGNEDRYIMCFKKITGSGHIVLERPIEREDVECEYNAELARLNAEKERIEKEIAEL